MRPRLIVITLALLYLPQYPPFPLAADGPKFTADSAVMDGEAIPLTARDAGIRYGQAAGAALVCYGLKTTTRVEELKGRYYGSDIADFDDQAARVLAVWKAALTCEKAGGPNECKLSHVWSCQQALKEIGPAGTAVPGLVEPKE